MVIITPSAIFDYSIVVVCELVKRDLKHFLGTLSERMRYGFKIQKAVAAVYNSENAFFDVQHHCGKSLPSVGL